MTTTYILYHTFRSSHILQIIILLSTKKNRISPNNFNPLHSSPKIVFVPRCLDVGACLKVTTRALGRGALHKKGDSIPLLLTSERHTGTACRQLFTRSVSTIQYPNHIYTKHPLVHDSPVSRTEYPKQPPCSVRDAISETLRDCQVKTAIIPVPADHLKVKISQSSIIYHSFHRSIRHLTAPLFQCFSPNIKSNPSKILNKL